MSEREMLAVYEWMWYWRLYLWERTFKAYTDHSPLTGIKTKKDITEMLTNMISKLQEYAYELIYTPGVKNVVADALLRELIAEKQKRERMNTERVIVALAREEGVENKEIHMEGKEFARWVLAIAREEGKEVKEKKVPFTMHKRKRTRAKNNLAEWAKRMFLWIDTPEEISKV